MIRPAFRGLRRRLDPDTYGGGYLLGLKGLGVVAHGNSSHRAIVSAIELGARGVRAGVVQHMAERLAARADRVTAAAPTS
jgi:glycerol-3-phosphate acyltransferase PlsX